VPWCRVGSSAPIRSAASSLPRFSIEDLFTSSFSDMASRAPRRRIYADAVSGVDRFSPLSIGIVLRRLATIVLPIITHDANASHSRLVVRL
jgi:hypothetical protein